MGFIWQKCASPDPKSINEWERTAEGNSYSLALKIRAAITWHFGIIEGLGNSPWGQNHLGEWYGNPSTSSKISVLMKSLARLKVHYSFDNIVPTSLLTKLRYALERNQNPLVR